VPELAEVEYFRKQWDAGLRKKVVSVALHQGKRIFRGLDEKRLVAALQGATYLRSEARAKLMCFRFSRDAWLGIHLGMSGKLRVEAADFAPGKHDHLVLRQTARSLVFSEPRMFGRVHFHQGPEMPAWWAKLPPAITGPEFTLDLVTAFFPRLLCGKLSAKQIAALWQETREVCRITLETVGVDFSDPPADWFYHQRWTNDGFCPRDGLALKTAAIGGRTTRWCPRCQR